MKEQTENKRAKARYRISWRKLGWDNYLFVFDSHHKVAEMMDKPEHSVYNRRWNMEQENPELVAKLKAESVIQKHNRIVEFYKLYAGDRYVPQEYRAPIDEGTGRKIISAPPLKERMTVSSDAPAIIEKKQPEILFINKKPQFGPRSITIDYKGHSALVPPGTTHIEVTHDAVYFHSE